MMAGIEEVFTPEILRFAQDDNVFLFGGSWFEL
jgi:hypothetical protein